mmetsp:Transcript_5198/g.10134  ORF Transcript_5198/g.10134 Transcript_5198/m.10134 type:complete len:256 (-) Transcript_5198:1722-2489(-)
MVLNKCYALHHHVKRVANVHARQGGEETQDWAGLHVVDCTSGALYCGMLSRLSHVVVHLHPRHFSMVADGSICGLHSMQNPIGRVWWSGESKFLVAPQARRLQNEPRFVHFRKVDLPSTTVNWSLVAQQLRVGLVARVIAFLGSLRTQVERHGQARWGMAMEVCCSERPLTREGSCDGVHPRAILGLSAAIHTLAALGNVVLYRRSDAPSRSQHVGVVVLLVRLHPEAELDVVGDGLVCPRDLLVGVQQRPHVVA